MLSPIERGAARPLGEAEVRRRIDRAIARAIVDREFAEQLLADPTLALDGAGCTPQQRLELRGISAGSIREFAAQAETRFWPSRLPQPLDRRAFPLAVGV